MNLQEGLTVLGLVTAFLSFFGLLEVAKRKFGMSPEITRRLAHIGSGLLCWLDYTLLSPGIFAFLILNGVIFIAVSYKFNLFTSVHNVRRKTHGEIYLAVGQLATWAVSLPNPSVFVPSLLVITFADAFAGLTSDLFKQQRKMWRGSAVFFVTAAAVLLLCGIGVWQTLLVAAATTVVERISRRGSDNLTVPVVCAGLLLLL